MQDKEHRDVENTIGLWMEHGEFLIENDNPFAVDAIANFIVAMEEDGSYKELVKSAKQHFKDVFGEW